LIVAIKEEESGWLVPTNVWWDISGSISSSCWIEDSRLQVTLPSWI